MVILYKIFIGGVNIFQKGMIFLGSMISFGYDRIACFFGESWGGICGDEA
jgi:hypothetical protein